MVAITDLPLELLLLIVEYVPGLRSSPSIFASVNRSLSRLLPRKIRRIYFSTDQEKLNSNEKRAKLLGMIDSPYHQLSLAYSKIDNLSELSFLTEIGGVSDLSAFDRSTSTYFTLFISQRLESLKVKRLRLYDPDVEYFDPIPGLESLSLRKCTTLKITKLNLPAFSLLQSLKLFDCPTVDDITCLDGIHELVLFRCPNIEDISCLNHNYRVNVSLCRKIITYSKSFRYTRSLEIMEDRRDINVICLPECNKLTSFALIYPALSISNIWFSSLLFLSLNYVSHFEALPPNRLQMVSIIRCHNFNSLDNMNHIRSIHLEDLNNITTLTGLGPKNQIITLKNMEQLEDISSLKESQVVKIRYCPLIKVFPTIVNSLASVKELELDQEDHTSMLLFISSLRQLNELRNLRVLDLSFIRIPSSFNEEECDALRSLILESLINIEKLVFHDNYNKIINEEIREQFIVVIRKEETILLRKRVISVD